MVTALLVASCFLTAVLFVIVASWMQAHTFRRAAAANLAAAICCAVSGLVLPFGLLVVPVTVLVAATLLGSTSLHAVRVGRG